jgi:ACS family hexuronate transporter-like MFS transporter
MHHGRIEVNGIDTQRVAPSILAVDPGSNMPSGPHGRVRWIIAALLFGETILNYLDLQTLSVLAPQLTQDLGLSNVEYARIGEVFQAAYLVSFIIGGWIIDRIGVRLGLSLSILWWSLAALSHGWATSVQGLMLCRFFLGLGYPGAYLAAAKAASEWFPPQERGLVTGIYTSGATVGATVAPPLIAWLALKYSWQYAFFVTGGAGVLYALVWFLVYRRPSEHPLLSAEEREYVLSSRVDDSETALPLQKSVPLLARDRHFWAVVLGRMIGDTPWIFYVMWIPKYLSDTQGLDLKAIGYIAWVPFLFSDVGSLAGGWFSGRFLRTTGGSPLQARLKVMLGCALVSMLTFTIYFLPSTTAIVAMMSLMMFSTMAWMVNLSTIPIDVFPKQIVGTAVGLTTVGAVLGQLVFTYFIGEIVQRYSYGPLFFIMSVLPPLAYAVIRAILPREKSGLEAGHLAAAGKS